MIRQNILPGSFWSTHNNTKEKPGSVPSSYTNVSHSSGRYTEAFAANFREVIGTMDQNFIPEVVIRDKTWYITVKWEVDVK